MLKPIHRSLLILPVNVSKFVEKAYLRDADAVMFDLEDAVPPGEKQQARSCVASAVDIGGRGGADVYVRVNNDRDLIFEDVRSAVRPGLHTIFLPKAEVPDLVKELDREIARLEQERGLAVGSIALSLHLESPLGLLRLEDLAAASDRTESMSIGADDYCLQLGVQPSATGRELFLPFAQMVNVARAYNLNPMGILGTVAGYKDLEGFRQSAERGKELGAVGAFCIHPDQVGVLNEVFTPSEALVENTRRVIEAFEEGLSKGRASVSLEGKMIDTPVYKRALFTLERKRVIEERQHRKLETLSRSQVS